MLDDIGRKINKVLDLKSEQIIINIDGQGEACGLIEILKNNRYDVIEIDEFRAYKKCKLKI